MWVSIPPQDSCAHLSWYFFNCTNKRRKKAVLLKIVHKVLNKPLHQRHGQIGNSVNSNTVSEQENIVALKSRAQTVKEVKGVLKDDNRKQGQ